MARAHGSSVVTSRLRAAFDRARAENRAALVVYLCGGDPDLATTPALLDAIARAGADVIELGIPFSDPTADGPVIQEASARARKAGATARGVLDALASWRRSKSPHADRPVVVFGYYNPILRMGDAAFARAARNAGADGLLVVDLPPEEAGTLADACEAEAMDLVPLLAPTSSDARIALAGTRARGFVYYVSTAGVTGAGGVDFDAAAARARTISDRLHLPVAVGFGVSSPDDARRVAAHADGVVVGSAVVRAIAGGDAAGAPARVAQLVRDLRGACGRA
ncbi:MAG: tryptophan synthase subunit alpha [Deltaproteobacteria bacterium]|nr:tryptophan synthase subunit alpha [Deltaproteobacteria bacterium]